MEIIPEGKIFRLVHDDELPSILKVLEKHLPYALKVRWSIIEQNIVDKIWAGKLMQNKRQQNPLKKKTSSFYFYLLP